MALNSLRHSSKKNRSTLTQNKKGFTLLEVILAITILSTLSVLVATSLSRALKAKRKIQAEVEDVSSLRDALKVMRSDIYLAYNHYDFEKEIFDTAKKSKNPPQPGQPNQELIPPRQTQRQDPRTHFQGENQKMGFVTLNNGRILANELQADFVEVGYELKACKNLTTEKSSQCLYRRVENILRDDDMLKGGTDSVLLQNVKEFKLKYIGGNKKEWVNEWKTKGGQDDSTKNIFPDAVEIFLAIERELDGKTREYSLNYVVPLHFPNNPLGAKTNSSGLAPGTVTPPTERQ